MFGGIGQPAAVSLSVHPLTTSVVLQHGSAGNVLVGYVSVQVRRRTGLESLAVRFDGDQRLDMYDGEGPSRTALSVRRQCADIAHTLVECRPTSGPDSAAATLAAAMAVGTARVRRSTSDDCPVAPSPPAGDAYAVADDGLSAGHRPLGVFSTSLPVVLVPGEYRFPFELALPSTLPPSVVSSLGHVAYQIRATMRRPARLFGSTVSSPPVGIRVYQVPRLLAGAPGGATLLGFRSLSALLSTPLLFESTVGGGRWKVSVYSPSSRVLFLGTPLKLRMYATRVDDPAQGCAAPSAGRLALAEFDVALYEYTTHAVPGSPVAPKITRRKVAASSLCPWQPHAEKQQSPPDSPRCSDDGSGSGILELADEMCTLDPQTIGALGEAFDDLPSVASLSLALPASGRRPVQASFSSPVFSVSHRLVVAIRACEGCQDDDLKACTMPARLSLSSRVI
ncbi:hypothetical protein LPJ61_005718, partial [Coemansia biformis]